MIWKMSAIRDPKERLEEEAAGGVLPINDKGLQTTVKPCILAEMQPRVPLFICAAGKRYCGRVNNSGHLKPSTTARAEYNEW